MVYSKKAVAVQLIGLQAWRANEKTLAAKMAKDERSTAFMEFNCSDSIKTKIAGIISGSFDDVVSPLVFDLKKRPWAAAITGIQISVHGANTVSLGPLPWGVAQAILPVRGEEVIMACPWSALPGTTYEDKQK